ncbi:macro domain-containing protein [bacterium]|nr:macro domain-containing protein [bacterium]
MDDICLNIKNTKVKVCCGDLLTQEVEAVVSPESTKLEMDLGVAAIIKEKAGEAVQREIAKIGTIPVGEVVVTSAGALGVKYIFHVATWENMKLPVRENMQIALKNCLLHAEEMKVKSIAFPTLALVKVKLAYDMCARVMMEEVFRYLLNNDSSLELIVFNLFNESSFNSFKKMTNILKEEFLII